MSDLVSTDRIEHIVGASRRATAHLARAVSAEQTVYVLHSRDCLESGIDLRNCAFSTALDRGIDPHDWSGWEDAPMVVDIDGGVLVPTAAVDPAGTAEHPCIGGDYCRRTTNGYFEQGSHGRGWYCGWCEAIPGAV
jgi:hypothetical protein